MAQVMEAQATQISPVQRAHVAPREQACDLEAAGRTREHERIVRDRLSGVTKRVAFRVRMTSTSAPAFVSPRTISHAL